MPTDPTTGPAVEAMAAHVLERLRGHRSIRRFKPTPVPEAALLEAVATGQTASTSSNYQAYSVLHVREPEVLGKLVPLTGGQEKVADCGAFLVFAADSRRHRLAGQDLGVEYEGRAEAFLTAVIDASLFAEKTAIAFEAMGFGICYIGGLRNELFEVQKLLRFPEGVYPLFGMCVGEPDETPTRRPRLDPKAVLFRDRYPEDRAIRSETSAYDEAYRAYLRARGARPEHVEAGWTGSAALKANALRRADAADFYRSLGARLD